MILKKLRASLLALTITAVAMTSFATNVYADEVDDTLIEQEGVESEAPAEGETGEGQEEGVSDNQTAGATAVTMSGITADNGLIIAATFPEDIVPTGFHKSSCTYQGQNIEIAYMDKGNGEVVLAYLAQADGSGGDFYLCDINTAAMSDFVQIAGGDGKYIIVLDPGDMIVPPTGFTKAKLQWYGKTVSAWIMEDEEGGNTEKSTDEKEKEESSIINEKSYASALFDACAGAGKTLTVYAAEATDASDEELKAALEATAEKADDGSGVVTSNPSDYFLVYGINQDGVISFYLYDTVENTYQRYLAASGVDSKTAKQYRSSAQRRLFIIAVLVILLAICIFITINLFLKVRENGDYRGDDDDDDDDDEDDEDEMEKMRRRVIQKEKNHIRTGRRELNYLMDRDDDDDEEDDDEEEDEEDNIEEIEDEDEEDYIPRKRTASKKAVEEDVDWEHMEIGIPKTVKRGDNNRPQKKSSASTMSKKAVSSTKRPTSGSSKSSTAKTVSTKSNASKTPVKKTVNKNFDEDFEFEFLDL